MCFCKQKTAYERRISDWSSDVCSSDLNAGIHVGRDRPPLLPDGFGDAVLEQRYDGFWQDDQLRDAVLGLGRKVGKMHGIVQGLFKAGRVELDRKSVV